MLYEINSKTCALVYIDDDSTEVIEERSRFVIQKSISSILEESCNYYGSSYQGRIEGSKQQLGMKYKLPITIEASKELIFFPTKTPSKPDCCWISVNHIKSYKGLDNCVLITFTGDHQCLFNLSLDSLENQITRATKLLLLNRNRLNN